MKTAKSKPIFVIAKRANGHFEPLGGFALHYLPRTGELIEREDGGILEMFTVIKVIHPGPLPAPGTIIVWATYAGTTEEVINRLIRENQ